MSRPLRILLGVTGGIAAYKSALLVRLLKKQGHEVRCAMSRSATAFLAPLTLEVLSQQPVYQEEYLAANGSGEELHVAAAAWADVLAVAPATANLLGRLALGLADDFLTTTILCFDGPLVLAPAMHTVMWRQPAVQGHVERLRGRGAVFVGPAEGALASGEEGIGRMAEPEEVAAAITQATAAGFAGDPAELAGRRVLISAGPTHEPIDPVRYLGNRSSGRMGFALAAEAACRGARVVLVAGPVELPTPPRVERRDVATALEMAAAVEREAPGADLIVMAAAVADFRPAAARSQKIKKEEGVPPLELVRNPDILAGLRDLAPEAVLVGFAAETEGLDRNARGKLAAKRLDFLVANDVSRADIGFGSDANEVTLYRRGGEPRAYARRGKPELARELLAVFAAAVLARPAPALR